MSKKMTMNEFNSMTNKDKVEHLNKYQGKTKLFQEENAFSWTYATQHCDYVKEGSTFIPKEPEPMRGKATEEDDWTIIRKYRQCKNVQKSVRLPDEFLNKLKQYASDNGLKESEVILCAVERYMQTNR